MFIILDFGGSKALFGGRGPTITSFLLPTDVAIGGGEAIPRGPSRETRDSTLSHGSTVTDHGGPSVHLCPPGAFDGGSGLTYHLLTCNLISYITRVWWEFTPLISDGSDLSFGLNDLVAGRPFRFARHRSQQHGIKRASFDSHSYAARVYSLSGRVARFLCFV
jgi:hypothetical protein